MNKSILILLISFNFFMLSLKAQSISEIEPNDTAPEAIASGNYIDQIDENSAIETGYEGTVDYNDYADYWLFPPGSSGDVYITVSGNHSMCFFYSSEGGYEPDHLNYDQFIYYNQENAIVLDPDKYNHLVVMSDNSGEALYIMHVRGDAVLPVELTTFEGSFSEEGVQLECETATEVNNYGFQVQRQKERVQSENEWEEIGFVQGHGTTNSPKNYEFMDSELPNSESVNYRLKQIDNDGSFAYSKTITVDLTTITSIDDATAFKFSLEQNYPNPFNPTTKISFTVPTSRDRVRLVVYDILGREVSTLVNKKLKPGRHQVKFRANDIPSGMYFYRINIGSEYNSVKKMLLIK